MGESLAYVRAALAIIVSPSNKLLVLTGSEWPERPERSLQPDLAGGAVEEDETVEQGLLREIKEETGLDIVAGSVRVVFQSTHPAKYQPGFWHNYYFIMRSTDENVRISHEHSAWRWVSLDEFITTPWRPSQRVAVDFLHEHRILSQYLGLTTK